MDQELADAAAYAPGRRCMCIHQMAALLTWNDVVADISKVWRHTKNQTLIVNWCVQLCQISSQSNDRALSIFSRCRSNKEKNKMS